MMTKRFTKLFLTLLVLIAIGVPCWAQYPATDAFSGTGALSASWTNTSATGYPYIALAKASGTVVPSVSGTNLGMATYTGVTFNANQYSQAKFVTHFSGSATGPCIRMTTTGNGYCYLADYGQVWILVNGSTSAGSALVMSCPVPASGDTLQLSVSGTTFTCTDVTTGVHASATDSTYSTGNPGLLVDQRSGNAYALAAFQADCVPTCATTTVATPTFSPVAGSYTSAQTVTISDATTGATLHYTTDGTTPTATSATYSTPITVSVSETVKAIGIKTGDTNSAVGSAAYVISGYPATDAFSGTGALSSNWTNSTATGTVYVAAAKASGTIVPSTSGSASLSVYTGETFTANQYSQAVFVTHNVAGGATGPCVRMSVGGNGYCYLAESGITMLLTNGSGISTVIAGCPIPASGDVLKLSVTGTTFTCTDVTTSTSASGTDSTYATGDPSLLVDQRNSTVYALASFNADCVPTCATGGGTVATPTFSPVAGTYTSAQTVTISDTTTGATLHYTTDGTTPTGSSTTYTTPISVAASETVKAIGIETGWTNSAVGSAAYVINLTVATPTFSPVAGTYTSAQTVTISTTTAGATLHYTTDGTTPTASSATYSSPIAVSVSETVKALGIKTGYANSAVGSAAYVINLTVATPTFSPVAGTYNAAQSVAISDATSGATLHYTTDGTTPTATSATYSTPISVAVSETIKALGIKTGLTNSAVGSAAYTLTVATPTFSPGAGSYPSTQTVTISTTSAGATLHYTTDGSTPTATSTTYSSPITVSVSETVKALGVKAGWTNSAVGSAAYTIGGTKTLSSIVMSPHGGVLTPGSTLQFSVVCTYTDLSTDNCAFAGGATWSVSRNDASISSSGLFTQTLGTAWQASHAYALGALVKDSNGYLEQAAVAGTSGSSITWPAPGGTDSSGFPFQDNDYYFDANQNGCPPCGVVDGTVSWNLVGSEDEGYAAVTAAGMSDKAQVWRQMPGDSWVQYMTPQNLGSLTVGSTITIGTGLGDATPVGHGGTPFQDSCTWSSSNTSIATVDIHGQVTGVAPGSVTITCGRAGNGTFGSSTVGGWVSPGNTVSFSVVAGGTSNTTWYVLPGGGTLYDATFNPSGQCSGLVNATYASTGGTGTNQACGAGNIRYLWADGVTYQRKVWKISGGDTVIVAQTAAGVGYNTGLDNFPGTWNPTNCAGDSFGCVMPSIPSGTAARHTKILGANYASCHADSAKTLLHVSYAAITAFNVTNSQFVDIACFEVTDEAACADDANYTNSCHNSSLNYGAGGIIESAFTSNVNYTDLFIHGLGGDGIAGATGVGVVADHVHIRAMPDSGINMDDGPWGVPNISVAGGLTMTNSITEFTGCVEEYPVVHNYPYIECRDSNAGSYGDGLGTASTTGNWVFDHDTWQYNYQDGLDLLHSGMQNLTVTNSFSQGNDGQAYKIGSADKTIFQNNIAMDNCNRLSALFGDEPASAIVPGVVYCRASGDWIPMSFTNVGSYTLQDNTFVGYGSTVFDLGTPYAQCEVGWDFCQNAATTFQNNVVLGYADPGYNNGDQPGLVFEETPFFPPNSGWAVRNHNNYYNIKSGTCPTPLLTGETCNTSNPAFTSQPASPISAESNLDNFNFKPASGSPLIGAGIAIPGITLDYTGATRPNPPSIGAIE